MKSLLSTGLILPAAAITFPWLAASAESALDAQGVKLLLFGLMTRLSLQVNSLVDLSFYFNVLVVYFVFQNAMLHSGPLSLVASQTHAYLPIADIELGEGRDTYNQQPTTQQRVQTLTRENQKKLFRILSKTEC